MTVGDRMKHSSSSVPFIAALGAFALFAAGALRAAERARSADTIVLGDTKQASGEAWHMSHMGDRVQVRNTRSRAGDGVVQLYIRDKISSVTLPVLELKGSERVRSRRAKARRSFSRSHSKR